MRTILTLCLVGTLCVAAPARAQDSAAAEGLFKEARGLMNQKDYVAACAKFAESQRLDPSSGTLLNLARCYNLQGKTATAWAKYLEAGRLARQQNRTAHADEARARAAELEPNLSYLTIVVTGLPNDATIERDDVRLEPGSLGSKLPIDPGPHLVKVRAPGYKDQQVSVTIGVAKDAQTLVVPA